jgi:hypothetical protein
MLQIYTKVGEQRLKLFLRTFKKYDFKTVFLIWSLNTFLTKRISIAFSLTLVEIVQIRFFNLIRLFPSHFFISF